MVKINGTYPLIGVIMFIPVLFGLGYIVARLTNIKTIEKAVDEATDGGIHEIESFVDEVKQTKEGRIKFLNMLVFCIILWPIQMWCLIEYFSKLFASIEKQKSEIKQERE
jgi:hypothetical protein